MTTQQPTERTSIYGTLTFPGHITDERLADEIAHWDAVIAVLQKERGEKDARPT